MLFVASGMQAQFLGKLLDKAAEKVVNKATGKSTQPSAKEKVDPIFLDPYYGSTTDNLFRFNAGKWNRMPDEFELDYEKNVEPAENMIVTSADGKRQAVVSGTAGFIRLPEGGVVYPNAVEVSGNTIRWSTFEKIEGQNQGEMDTWQIVECTYSL